ncbi:MAG: hypothetical protein H6625_12425 [Bdellovibrionaceae bacterium]|nr:hypothetical protein [Pseudobdellovibrionaceae bacterium]MCB9026774.1 hypothetical protein [Pseudobdellovibrionaceae bacterium]MCB9026998.1 hypothetical protein [Pseudobdellovibrionaceae bacterium]MCB9027120.1 hypothetical protein [Pseudobdellovibrionaceae bacterium]
MSKRKQYNYNQVERRQIVDDYYAKKITSAQLASEYSLDVSVIHRWKYELDRRKKTERKDELLSDGRSAEDVKYIMQLEEELSEYKKQLGQAMFENDLLKKAHSLQHKKKSTGLEIIKKELAQSKGRVK